MGFMDNSPYLPIYYRRINHLGETNAERVQKAGELAFEKMLENSVHTVRGLSVERGLFFDGIITTNKDKEYEKTMLLNVANNVAIQVGDILNWVNEEGNPEKWLLFSREKKVNGTYQTFTILRCNYFIRWVDALGHVQGAWSHVLSSLDSKVKGNFRTWNSLITPQPNKQANFILPTQEIARSTTFIIEEEAWSVIEYDHTSVEGIMYVSLTEDKINLIYDDVPGHLADTHKIADYQLVAPEGTQHFALGAEIQPTFSLTKNGLPIDEPLTLLPTDKYYIKNDHGTLIARNEGATKVLVQLTNYPQIRLEFDIIIDGEPQEFDAYIEGNDKIMLDRTSSYTLIGTTSITDAIVVTWSLDETDLAEIVTDPLLAPVDAPPTCTIKTNAKNLLGTITLRAHYGDKEYTKQISVIPVWLGVK